MGHSAQLADPNGIAARYKLADKQWRFVQAYVFGEMAGNGKQCAIIAGYSKRSAETTAAHLLGGKHPKIGHKVLQAIAEAEALKQQQDREAGRYTREQSLAEYELARRMAQDLGQPAAMVAAIKGKARLYGYDQDRSIISELDAEDMGREEREQIEQLAREIWALKQAKRLEPPKQESA